MLRKFFPLDKNYILEKAQLSLERPLLLYLLDFVKVEYLLRTNPLGLADGMSEKIRQHEGHEFRQVHDFYVNLMGVFRYMRYHDNQLEFLFDGTDDFEKYQQEWSQQFKRWCKEFCRHRNFLRAFLDLTVFYPENSPVLMVDNRMNAFLSQHFAIRIHPQKGIIRKMA